MVGLKHQLSVNMSRKGDQSRVTFSQRSWAGLMLVAGLIGVARGAPIPVVLFLVLVSLAPIGIWAMAARASADQQRRLDDLYILTWMLIGFLAMAIGGGALSPLVIILVLGPFGAVLIGRAQIAAEVAVFGVLAYGASIVAGWLGWSDVAPLSWQNMIAPWAIAGMVQIVVLLWAAAPLFETGAGLGASPASEAVPANGSVAQDLSMTLPLLVIDVAPHGRIRRIEGAKELRWTELVAGKVADTVLGALEEDEFTAPNGDVFGIIRADCEDGGRWIGLVPQGAETSAGQSVALAEALAETEAVKTELADRTAFFAGLGHDLKTPLNAVLGFADLMRAEVRGPLPDAYKDYPGIIHESGQDLMLLVDDILDLAKSEASGHRLDLEPVDLVASGASVVRQLSDQAERAGVKLVLKDDAEVWAEADARAVRQIWQNLVSNAIKYSETGGMVTLLAGKAAGAVAISVQDRGAGMDQGDLDRIAKPFAQGANAKGRAGTGLGLAVVHRFAELHGGKVVIDTAPGKGTRVRVTLPASDMTDMGSLEDAAQ